MDDIMVARAAEQIGAEDFRIRPEKTYPCPAPGCEMRFSPQSKLKLCPVHSKVVYAKRQAARRARERKAK